MKIRKAEEKGDRAMPQAYAMALRAAIQSRAQRL
jgi:hypothetical protein